MNNQQLEEIVSDFAQNVLEDMHSIINRCYVEHEDEKQTDYIHALIEHAFMELLLHNAGRHEALRAGGDPTKMVKLLEEFPTGIAVNAEIVLDDHLDDVVECYTTLPNSNSNKGN